ncbi:unnamed protein product, partial [Choristocarpus tenellus]
ASLESLAPRGGLQRLYPPQAAGAMPTNPRRRRLAVATTAAVTLAFAPGADAFTPPGSFLATPCCRHHNARSRLRSPKHAAPAVVIKARLPWHAAPTCGTRCSGSIAPLAAEGGEGAGGMGDGDLSREKSDDWKNTGAVPAVVLATGMVAVRTRHEYRAAKERQAVLEAEKAAAREAQLKAEAQKSSRFWRARRSSNKAQEMTARSSNANGGLDLSASVIGSSRREAGLEGDGWRTQELLMEEDQTQTQEVWLQQRLWGSSEAGGLGAEDDEEDEEGYLEEDECQEEDWEAEEESLAWEAEQ